MQRLYASIDEQMPIQYAPTGTDTVDVNTFESCFNSSARRANYLHQLQTLDALYQTKMICSDPDGMDLVLHGQTLLSIAPTGAYYSPRLLLAAVSGWTAGATYTTIGAGWASSMVGTQGRFVTGSSYRVYNGSSWTEVALAHPAINAATRRAAYKSTNYVTASNASGYPLLQYSSTGSSWAAASEANSQPTAGTSLNSLVYVSNAWIGNGLADCVVGVTYASGGNGFVVYGSSDGENALYYPHDISGGASGSAITYDYQAGLFVFGTRGTSAKVYYANDPTAGVWLGGSSAPLGAFGDILAVGGVWLAVTSGDDVSSGEVYLSLDHGSNWEPLGIGAVDQMVLVDRRVAFLSTYNGIYLSGVVGAL